MLTYLFSIFKRKEAEPAHSYPIWVPETTEFRVTELVEQFDDMETKRIHEELKNTLGLLPRLMAKLNLSGRWGFLLLSTLTILPLLTQKIINSSTVTPTADPIDPMDLDPGLKLSLLKSLFSLPNIINLAPGLLTALGLYSVHNSAVALNKFATGDLRVTANAQCAGLITTVMAAKMRERGDVEDSAEVKVGHKMVLRSRRGSIS
jgi:hypothetical protein